MEDESPPARGSRLMTPGEVAALFRVSPKTVSRWAASGRLPGMQTPGNHWRFNESTVHELLQQGFDGDYIPGEGQ